MGGSNPEFLHVDSIFFRSMALAICLKFHVSKYFIPLVAAMAIWNASLGSDAGLALDKIS